jgi:pilus assembly protein Flp/PilA
VLWPDRLVTAGVQTVEVAMTAVPLSRQASHHPLEGAPMFNAFTSMLRDDEGATLVEYALIVSLIAAVCIVAVKLVGTNASASLTNAAGNIK